MKTMKEVREEAAEPAVMADSRGIVTYVNQRFEEVFGWNSSEIVGRPLAVIIPTYLHDSHHLGFSRFIATGRPTLLNRPLKLKAVTKEGKEFDAEHTIYAEQIEGQWMFGATIRPV